MFAWSPKTCDHRAGLMEAIVVYLSLITLDSCSVIVLLAFFFRFTESSSHMKSSSFTS